MPLWRVQTADGPRLARGPLDGGPVELLRGGLAALLAAGSLAGEAGGPVPGGAGGPGARGAGRAGSVALAPVGGEGGWAAGVTSRASGAARNEESGGHDF